MRFSTEPSDRRRRIRTEQGYVRAALISLRRLGIPSAWEAPVLGRSIDLAFLHEGCICTVEFKKRDWRRALRQAHDHLLGADFAYVCLPEVRVSNACLQAARATGIGILALRDGDGWPFEVIVEASRSPETWQVARDRLLEQLRK
jgi:hypothetical protein